MRIIIKPLIYTHTHTPLGSFLDQSLPNYSTYLFKLWRVAIFWRAFQMRYQCLRNKHVTLAAPRFKDLWGEGGGGENVVLTVIDFWSPGAVICNVLYWESLFLLFIVDVPLYCVELKRFFFVFLLFGVGILNRREKATILKTRLVKSVIFYFKRF